MLRKAFVLLMVGYLLFLGGPRSVRADGTIILTNLGDFQNYLSGNSLHGTLNGMNTAIGSGDPAYLAVEDAFHVIQFQPVSTTLSTLNSTSPPSGLLSASASSVSQVPGAVGGWSFRYLADPDLTNYVLNAEIYLPQVSSNSLVSGIDDLTFSLVDTNHTVASWDFSNLQKPGELEAGLQNFQVNFAEGAAGGGDGYSADSGFSLQTVSDVVVSYRGLQDTTFPLIPQTGDSGLWIDTTSFTVTSAVPEPGPFVVLGIGSGMILAIRVSRFRQRRERI